MSELIQKPILRTEKETLEIIRNLLVGKSVKKAYLFGSRARGDATSESDWDILIDIEKGFSLFDQAEIQIKLEDEIGQKVDLVTAGGLRSDIRSYIDKDKILIYER
jgi:predicted nucleotidyltransferase